jgi:hypothetical protein
MVDADMEDSALKAPGEGKNILDKHGFTRIDKANT